MSNKLGMDKRNTPIVVGLQGALSANGWIAPQKRLDFSEWECEFNKAMVARRSLQFAIGDILNYGEEVYGGDFSQVLDEDMSQQRLATYKWVASAFPYRLRRSDLSWTHHKHLASLPNGKRQEVMNVVLERAWTVHETYYFVSAWKTLGEYGMDVDEAEAWATHAISQGWTVPSMKRQIALSKEDIILDAIDEFHPDRSANEAEERPAAFVMPAGELAAPAIEAGRNLVLRLFIDVELTRQSPSADLVSLGIVTMWGDEFYAEFLGVDFTDMDQVAIDEILPTLRLSKNIGSRIDPSTGRWLVAGDKEFVFTEMMRWASQKALGAPWEVWMDMPGISWPAILLSTEKMDIPLPDSPLDVATLLWATGKNYNIDRARWGQRKGERDAMNRARVVFKVWQKVSKSF